MNEGLRDRKKRLLRQQISDVATGMFLERGFDEVRVGEIAAACDVSEKTVYNYFPTKESLIFDREEDQALQIGNAILGSRGVPLIDAVLAVLDADTRAMHTQWDAGADAKEQLGTLRRFAAMIEDTPALSAAMNAMTERLTQVAAVALAERAGVDPDDPEPQIAATLILGLWRVQFLAMLRYADDSRTINEFTESVLGDIRRAAAVANGGLASFNIVVGSSNATDGMHEAAAAAEQARRQVIAAVKQARVAWRHVMAEVQRHHQHEHDMHDSRHRTKQELRAQQLQLKAEIRQFQHELRLRQAALRSEQEQARRNRRR